MHFSIIIPTLGRPELFHDALQSACWQKGSDIEIAVSNNGGSAEVRAIVERAGDARIRYFESAVVLPMAEHWDICLQRAGGTHVIILPDRRIMHPGTIGKLRDWLAQVGHDTPVTWSCDTYLSDERTLVQNPENTQPRLYRNSEVTELCRRGTFDIRYLPTGLNSCISRPRLDQLIAARGIASGSINPDYTLGFGMAAIAADIFYCGQSLFTAQGINVSNGIRGYRGTAQTYINSVGLAGYRNFDLRPAFVDATIYDDCLTVFRGCGRELGVGEEFFTRLGTQLVGEYITKRIARVLPADELAGIRASLQRFLDQHGVRRAAVANGAVAGKVLRAGATWMSDRNALIRRTIGAAKALKRQGKRVEPGDLLRAIGPAPTKP